MQDALKFAKIVKIVEIELDEKIIKLVTQKLIK